MYKLIFSATAPFSNIIFHLFDYFYNVTNFISFVGVFL